MASQPPKDQWSSKTYNEAGGFVPKLASKVVELLSPSPSDHILDIGCGDGPLTAQIAQTIPSGKILGLDASESMIKTAKEKFTSTNCTFERQDCAQLNGTAFAQGQWDKVFSNAAFHWILGAAENHLTVFRGLFAALRPGGTLVFEMGGAGNIAEVHTALIGSLMAHGMSKSAAEKANPWCFPSVEEMRNFLSQAGFDISLVESEYRPTRLTDKSRDGGGGLEGWIRLFGDSFLQVVPEEKRDEIVSWAADCLESIVTRDGGSQWLGYVRLRAVARKPM
ncbi:S-adenosyl-L-methionine-dependent methyltransferase [Lineolata rhizophorae]|uniref:S-adenosyl-L-methionine-dependent methyltransferase n=1 Tax=Lineolata rhizophorae TaxID=578093 RepID=A0A6A6NYX4_9PEZI|nr:S-adenosyl-L-methionine-dependent methyltransferase [Lineolata rhizophorae]